MAIEPIKARLGYYRHYKGGMYYLKGFATSAEKASRGANWAFYIDVQDGKNYVRPFCEFFEMVEGKDGKVQPRFLFMEMGSIEETNDS